MVQAVEARETIMSLNYSDLNFKKRIMLGSFFFALAGIFFLYEFFLRASFGSMEATFSRDIKVDATTVGMISSAYFLAYSIMQIPVGFLVDRFGVRKAGSIAILVCAVGCLCFSLSNSVATAWWGRFAIGFGSAFAFVMMLKIVVDWFPHRVFGMMAGMTQVLGAIGPIIAGAPFAYLLIATDHNWRGIFHYIALIGVILGIVFFLIVRDSDKLEEIKEKSAVKKDSIFSQVKALFSYGQLWIVAIYIFFGYASIELLGSLFGPRLMQIHGFSLEQATGMVSLLWLGLAIGSPIVGLISDMIGRRKIVLIICSMVGLISVSFLLWGAELSGVGYSFLFFILGFSIASQTLSFSVVVENVPKSLEATAMGVNNMFVLLGAMVIQMLGGYLVHYFWKGKISSNGEHLYTLYGFNMAMSICIVFFVIALLMSIFLIRETYCKRRF